jgi:uncharacterized protein (TIGR03435 family)
MWLRIGCIVATFSFIAPAQRPAFEVASIKPGNPASRMLRSMVTPGNLRAENVTLRTLIEDAYQIKPFQLLGGPHWIDQDRFEVIAKGDSSAGADKVRLMLQALLEDRFQLTLHRETKQQNISLLTVKTQPKIKPSKEGSRQYSSTMTQRDGVNHVSFYATPMAKLADFLAREMGQMVEDRTGLKGAFDFELDASREEAEPNPFVARLAPSIGQIGLKLETTKGPVEFFVIGRAEKPRAN